VTAVLLVAAILAQVRDAPTAATGTASVSGTVTTQDTTPRPIRRAVVTVNSQEPRVGRTAVTDDAGRFAVTGLPPGRYTVVASRRGWVTTPYGTKTAGRGGRLLTLAAGEQASASIAMPRGAVISGTITDPSGALPNGLTVRVMRYSYGPGGGRTLGPAGTLGSTIDERGQYRIYGLTPGEYYVSAASTASPFGAGADLHLTTDVDVQEAQKAVDGGPSVPIVDVPQRGVTFLATLYPGTTSPAQATPIAVRAGEERTGVDFSVQYSSAVHVDGVVTAPAGAPVPAGTQVTLAVNDPATPVFGFDGIRTARPGPDGRFEFGQIAPGPYVLVARAAMPPAPGSSAPQVLSASMDLDVQSEDQHDLALVLEDTFTLTGTVRFDGDGTPPSLRGQRVLLQPPAAANGVIVSSGGTIVSADGTFTVSGVTPGRYHLGLAAGPQLPWVVRSATIAGRDALDGVVDVRQSLGDALITITDRLTSLNGHVEGPSGADYTMILFSQNRDYWTSPTRRVMTARTAKDGTFAFARVPPGDYALAAVEDVEPGEWFDPAFLQRIAPTAVPLTLAEGEKKTQDITVR
jgi:uncharacterized protein (DUF2141 family)